MASFIGDDLAIEIERHLKTAVEVCIAAAFVNFQGVELLRKYIERTLNGRSYKINFLLDKDFHPHPAAREAIIKELCTIPDATVRVFSDDTRRLHMKVYIFSGENSVSVIAGSYNPTGAGLTKNIEAGLLTSNPQAVQEAQEYFKEYWDKAAQVIPNPNAYYKEPLFQVGQRVRHRGTNQYGVIVAAPSLPVLRGETWYYQVLMTDEFLPIEYGEHDLRAMVVLEAGNDELLVDRFMDPDGVGYLREVLHRKLITPVRDGLFSYMASRTEVVAYQFKPLLKLLASDSYRILIADEVGLGKTIEAGIIFTELKARFSKMRRALVVCPTNLKTKWKDELESRFDEYFKLLNREELTSVVSDSNKACFGIVSYELLGHDEMIDLLRERESSWDFLILDEAHHLRNKNKRNRAVAHIAKFATAVVMLSATPINLGVKDLTHLLQILLPRDYRDVDDIEFMHRLEPNRYLFEAVGLVAQDPKRSLELLKKMEIDCKYASRVCDQLRYQQVKSLLENKETLSKAEVARVYEELTNLNTLANIITRTRKEDVGSGTTREVITYEVEFTDFERQLYQELTGLARIMAGEGSRNSKGKKGKSLAVMMPQRQAASCLAASIDYIRDLVSSRTQSTVEVSGEIEDDADSEEAAEETITTQSVIREAKRILQQYSENIVFEDTKYNKLKEFLSSRAMKDGRLDKVIIFTGFRRTLTYLQKRLEHDFGIGSTVEIHGDIQPLSERDQRRRRFQDSEGPSILL